MEKPVAVLGEVYTIKAMSYNEYLDSISLCMAWVLMDVWVMKVDGDVQVGPL